MLSIVRANFRLATFSAAANFRSATFSAYADFSSATFSAGASFSSAKFLENSQTVFWATDFCEQVSFESAIIEGIVEFDKAVFWDKQQVQNVQDELKNRFEILQEKFAKSSINPLDPNSYLSLAKARFSKPERISFNSMSLRPNWFVQVEDERKIVFNDVEWRNIEIDVDRTGLDEEFTELTNRDVDRPRESLIKACNQLADNAEANRRFEEAKKFRKQAIALKKYKCHIHDSIDAEEQDSIRKEVCQEYPVVNEDGGNYFCLWHNPDKSKAEVFLQEFEKRRTAEHTDFRGVTFPISIHYRGGELPKELDFSGATFERRVAFDHTKIHTIKFDKAYFTEDSELVFEESRCDEKISLKEAIFDGKFYLNGSSDHEFFGADGSLSLEDIRFDKPNQVNFRAVRLRPYYFVNVDASKFNFHDCNWKDYDGKKLDIHEEIQRCSGSKKLLAQVCNQLAINYEESRNFEESSYFRYTAMEAKRLVNRGVGKVFNLYWFYKGTSGYGENWRRAALVLVGLLVLFGYLYAMPFASFDYGNPKPKPANTVVQRACDKVRMIGNNDGMNVCDGIVHSLSVATFQRPEPKSADFLTKLIIVFEIILVPLQAALLALAIRRKFMR